MLVKYLCSLTGYLNDFPAYLLKLSLKTVNMCYSKHVYKNGTFMYMWLEMQSLWIYQANYVYCLLARWTAIHRTYRSTCFS